MDNIVDINGISKFYGRLRALDDFSLQIPRGVAFGILGPNGSGKTTLLGILLNILNADRGSFQWHMKDNAPNPRLKIGALLETPNFYPYLSAVDNLKITCKIKGSDGSEIDENLKWVGLYERRHTPFKTYSLGMRQRLAIAAALMGDPEVLIFDEPTNGLDPQGIAEVRELILKIAKSGKTIIMASHILDEVEKICSHVAIIRKGILLQTGTVGNILQDNVNVVEVSSNNNEALKSLMTSADFVSQVASENDLIILSLDKSIGLDELNAYTYKNGQTLNHLKLRKKRLEDEFISIIKNQ